jgi:hypothetical protein
MISLGDVGSVPCPLPLMYPCGFFHFHDTTEAEPASRIVSDVTLDHLVTKWQENEVERKELEKQLKELTKVLRNYKEGIQEWLKAEGHNGQKVVTDIDGEDWELITELSKRAGYEVKPSEFQKTTIKKAK